MELVPLSHAVWSAYSSWFSGPQMVPKKGLWAWHKGELKAGVCSHIDSGPYVLFTNLAFSPTCTDKEFDSAMALIAKAIQGICRYEGRSGLLVVENSRVQGALGQYNYTFIPSILMGFTPQQVEVAAPEPPREQPAVPQPEPASRREPEPPEEEYPPEAGASAFDM